jgi:hypothetical protein
MRRVVHGIDNEQCADGRGQPARKPQIIDGA